ncbi:hypothetical protein RCIP0096_00071 [Klebsiella phage RCIP0096]
MSDYVTPTITCGNFTKGKHYEVFREYPGPGTADRVRINDDNGLSVIAFVGVPSSLLCYKGCFHRVSFETSDAISMSGVYRKEPIQNSESFVFRDGRLYINKAKIGGAIMTSGALKPSGEDWVKRCERLQEQVNELIAANEEVRKILRCPDGFDIRKQAQVVRTLADTLLAISK